MKKRILTLALALTLMVFAAIPAMAVDTTVTTSNGTGNSTITYTVSQSFTVTIPEGVTLNAERTGSLVVSIAAKARILPETSILVKLTTCDFKLTNSDDNLVYTLKKGETAITQGAEVLTLAAGEQEATSATLDVSMDIDVQPIYSGNYTDLLTFTVTVTDPPVAEP